ncbi:MAG: hypothetical protein AABW93_03215 [Nanoarchaeota archaeon]
MAQLEEVAKVGVGKSSFDMRCFFQKMVKKGKLKAYLVEVDKQEILSDTKEERIVRTKKGSTLTSITELRENQQVILKDSKTGVMYTLNIGSRGGEFYNEGDSQTIYNHCVLKKLAQKFDPKTIKINLFNGEFSISEEMVTAKLRISYDEDWEGSGEVDRVAGTRGNLVVTGEQDSLFQKVHEFVTQNSQ